MDGIFLYSFYILLIAFKINADYVIFEVGHMLLHERYFWYYNNISFADQDDLLSHISTTYPELRQKVVIVKIVGQYNSRGGFYPDKIPQVFETCLPSLDKPKAKLTKRKFNLPNDDVTVTFSLNGETSFKCNKRQVYALQDLVDCATKRRHIKFGSSCHRTFDKDEPPICVKQKPTEKKSIEELFCEKPNVLYLVNLQKKYKKNSLSNKIWSNIWQNKYSYGCYSRFNYRLLKERYLRELNEYRRIHNITPLVEKYEMSTVAQKRANRILQLGRIIPDTNLYYDEVIGSSEILHVPFMIKKWYETVSKYNFHTTFIKQKSKNFVKLFLKSTTHVGFGFVKIKCNVVVVLKFLTRKKNFIGNTGNIKRRVKYKV